MSKKSHSQKIHSFELGQVDSKGKGFPSKGFQHASGNKTAREQLGCSINLEWFIWFLSVLTASKSTYENGPLYIWLLILIQMKLAPYQQPILTLPNKSLCYWTSRGSDSPEESHTNEHPLINRHTTHCWVEWGGIRHKCLWVERYYQIKMQSFGRCNPDETSFIWASEPHLVYSLVVETKSIESIKICITMLCHVGRGEKASNTIPFLLKIQICVELTT